MAGMTLQRPTAQRSSGMDLFYWYFLRISGALLVILALGHIFITHYLNVPSETTSAFVLARWANPLWRTFDWLLLMAAVTHGIIGLRLSIEDYLHKPGLRAFAQGLSWVLAAIFVALGTVTVFTLNVEANKPGVLNDQLWIAKVIDGLLVLIAIMTYLAVIAFIAWVVMTLVRGGAPVYWGDPGQYAWVMHRATGLGVLFFLLVHIIDIALIGLGHDLYNETVSFYSFPLLIPMEIMLVGAVIYHSLNGIRVILIDFWKPGGARLERPLYYVMLGLTILFTLPSAVIILLHEFGR